MNSLNEVNIKNCRYYFSDVKIHVKNLDPNKTKIDNKSYNNILIYYYG